MEKNRDPKSPIGTWSPNSEPFRNSDRGRLLNWVQSKSLLEREGGAGSVPDIKTLIFLAFETRNNEKLYQFELYIHVRRTVHFLCIL